MNQPCIGHTVSSDMNSQVRVQQTLTLERSEMRNNFARACVSALPHSYAHEWKSMDQVQCDRSLTYKYGVPQGSVLGQIQLHPTWPNYN